MLFALPCLLIRNAARCCSTFSMVCSRAIRSIVVFRLTTCFSSSSVSLRVVSSHSASVAFSSTLSPSAVPTAKTPTHGFHVTSHSMLLAHSPKLIPMHIRVYVMGVPVIILPSLLHRAYYILGQRLQARAPVLELLRLLLQRLHPRRQPVQLLPQPVAQPEEHEHRHE